VKKYFFAIGIILSGCCSVVQAARRKTKTQIQETRKRIDLENARQALDWLYMSHAIKHVAKTRNETKASEKLFKALGKPSTPTEYEKQNDILGSVLDRICRRSNVGLALQYASISAARWNSK
jgi:hypothetical protein